MSYSYTAPRKDPDAALDYQMNWAAWLAEGETITVKEINATEGLTVSLARIMAGGKTVAWRLSGGVADTDAFVTIRITTSAGQRDDRTIRVPVRQR
ncbi:MAG: hypothetical protein MUF47_08860 [Porphyrobacter sp.]|jgi:hypothetical protein|nr:hypothetical protein [Porphyrobacter sp.]